MYHKGQVLGEYLSDVPFCNFDGKKILEDTANHQYKNYLESGRFILKDLHSDQQDVLDPYHIEGPLAWDNKLSECQMNADKWRHKYEELYHYYKTNVQQVFRVKQDD